MRIEEAFFVDKDLYSTLVYSMNGYDEDEFGVSAAAPASEEDIVETVLASLDDALESVDETTASRICKRLVEEIICKM